MERHPAFGVAVLVLALLAGAFVYDVVTTPPLAATHPQANLAFEYHPETDSVTVTHRSGESIGQWDATALDVYVFPADESRPSAPRTTIALPFSKGDTVTVSNVTDSDRVVVLLRSESGSHVMGKYSVHGDESG